MFELIFLNIYMMIYYNFKKKLYFLSNMIFLMSFLMIMKLNNLNWWLIHNNMSMNIYSYSLILLTLWIFGMIMMNMKYENNLSIYMNIMMIMLLTLILNFLSMNLFIFYISFEINLLLIFFMVIFWGYGIFRIMAGYYLMFYTLIFSMPLLMIMFYLFKMNNNLSFPYLEIKKMTLSFYILIYLVVSFMVKIPIYSLHSWLLKAHVEASYIGSMILASIMLKLGSYGLLRLILIFNKFIQMNFMIYLSITGSLFLSLLCLRQIDMKIIVAMSSIIHMALMICGMLTLLKLGIKGGLMMMIAHGLCSSGMFYLINIIYKQTNSRIMILNKGMMMFMPSMSLLWFMMCSSNMAAPLSLNLISEIILLMTLYSWLNYFMMFLIFYCLLSFIYSLYLYSYIQHNFINMLNFYKIKINKLINFYTLILHWIPINFMILNLFII